jgi:glycosyltransferase involved in cell wall biosynthesis
VIASVRGDSSTAHTIHEGGFGRVVPVDDPRALADAIVALADDPSLAARLGANARRYFMAQYDRAARTAELEEILRRHAGGKARRRRTGEPAASAAYGAALVDV